MDLKDKKLRKGKISLNVAAAEDRITNLPDYIVHQILSFLELKYIVRTRVLSKSWGRIFNSIPTLNFLGFENMKAKTFMDTVDRILHLHDMSNLLTFRIVYEARESIYGARESICLPSSLFTCETLTSLELYITSGIYLPESMSCPRLKRLELHGAIFVDKNEKLFSDCSVLKELILENCDWSGIKDFSISAPALKIFKVKGFDAGYRWDNSCGLQNCLLTIDAPNLESLSYKCDLPEEPDTPSFQALVDADLDFNFDKHAGGAKGRQYRRRLGAAASRFFQVISHVKRLSISERVLRALSFIKDPKKHLPMFHHLKHLNVEREASTDRTLIALLQSAPNLESLEFNEYISMYTTYHLLNGDEDEGQYHGNDDDGLDLDMVTIRLPHLKSVSFNVFSGQPREMSWVKLILKNAEALGKMNVFHHSPCTRYPNAKSKEELKAEVQSLFTASESCVWQISSVRCPH